MNENKKLSKKSEPCSLYGTSAWYQGLCAQWFRQRVKLVRICFLVGV